MPSERLRYKTNCIGYAFYRLGIKPTDGFVDPAFSYEEHGLEVVPLSKAPALAVVSIDTELVVHMAVFDGKDRRTIWERE